MGKAVISSHLGAGLYSVAIQYDNARVTARLAVIAGELTKIVTDIAETQSEYDTDKAKHVEALAAMNAYLGTPGYTVAQLMKLSGEVMAAQAAAELTLRKLNILKLRKTAMEKEQASLQTNAPDTRTVNAWCADLTTSLSGEVGTVEVDYEAGKSPSVIVLPGDMGALSYRAPYVAGRDGILHHPHDQSPHQMYTNRAWLPAMQKWKPRYRIGTITALSGDNCDLVLDEAKSSQQALEINQSSSLSSVPIVYMTCNGAAFTVNDRVVVAFNNNWNTPTVIGFESNPKICFEAFQIAFTCPNIELSWVYNSTIALASDKGCGIYQNPAIREWTWDFNVSELVTGGFTRTRNTIRGSLVTADTDFKYEVYKSGSNHYRHNIHTTTVTVNGYSEVITSEVKSEGGPYKVICMLYMADSTVDGKTRFFYDKKTWEIVDGVYTGNVKNTFETIEYSATGSRTTSTINNPDTHESLSLIDAPGQVFTTHLCPYSGDPIYPDYPYTNRTESGPLSYSATNLYNHNYDFYFGG